MSRLSGFSIPTIRQPLPSQSNLSYTLRGHEWHFLIESMPEASQLVAGG